MFMLTVKHAGWRSSPSGSQGQLLSTWTILNDLSRNDSKRNIKVKRRDGKPPSRGFSRSTSSSWSSHIEEVREGIFQLKINKAWISITNAAPQNGGSILESTTWFMHGNVFYYPQKPHNGPPVSLYLYIWKGIYALWKTMDIVLIHHIQSKYTTRSC